MRKVKHCHATKCFVVLSLKNLRKDCIGNGVQSLCSFSFKENNLDYTYSMQSSQKKVQNLTIMAAGLHQGKRNLDTISPGSSSTSISSNPIMMQRLDKPTEGLLKVESSPLCYDGSSHYSNEIRVWSPAQRGKRWSASLF